MSELIWPFRAKQQEKDAVIAFLEGKPDPIFLVVQPMSNHGRRICQLRGFNVDRKILRWGIDMLSLADFW